MYRSVIAVGLLLVYHGNNLKNIMYDTIDRDSIKPLITRMIAGNIVIFIIVMSVKYFPLTTCAMILNCAPIVSTFMAGPILGEKVTIVQILSLIVAFCGISLMILGGNNEIRSPAYTPTPIIYFAFIILPFFLSISTLATRAARKLNESVVSFYMASSLLVVTFVICLSTG